MINGRIEVQDLPGVWDQKMFEYLGANTEGNYQDGCLQDVHWPSGLFGYFPSYTIGAMTAAQLFSCANKDKPEILPSIAKGDFNPLMDWLRTNVHSKGSSLSSKELITEATGESLSLIHI